MTKINITCDTCKKTFVVGRTNEMPDEVTELFCNWCPSCDSDEDYEERYSYEPLSSPPDLNQVKLEI